MLCKKCGTQLPDESVFCSMCGKKQAVERRAKKSRGNGQGTVFKLSNGKYRAEVCGVKRIMEYSDKRLTFVTADGTFFICGNRLYCSAYKNKAVIVEGEIEKMGFDMGDENGNY